MSSAMQILNYYLLAGAVLAAAYVGALSQGLYGVAGWIGLGGSVVSLAAFYGGYAQALRAYVAFRALRELEERLAVQADVPSLWDEPSPTGRLSRHARGEVITIRLMFIAASVCGIVAAIYAFLHM
jgi:hypothetical protein